jgi:hypothetical protein
MMSGVGAAMAPDTTAAPVLAHAWATGAAGLMHRVTPLLAHLGPPAMSAFPPLFGVKRNVDRNKFEQPDL